MQTETPRRRNTNANVRQNRLPVHNCQGRQSQGDEGVSSSKGMYVLGPVWLRLGSGGVSGKGRAGDKFLIPSRQLSMSCGELGDPNLEAIAQVRGKPPTADLTKARSGDWGHGPGWELLEHRGRRRRGEGGTCPGNWILPSTKREGDQEGVGPGPRCWLSSVEPP